MILFILLAIGFALYTIFSDSGLIDSIKNIEETNKEVYGSVPKIIFQWFLLNIFFNVINFIFVFIISAIVVLCCPKAESYYTFNINSLKDNLVTSGEIHGGEGLLTEILVISFQEQQIKEKPLDIYQRINLI